MKHFLNQLGSDWKKIVWPTRSDVFTSFLMSIFLAAVFSVFFLFADKAASMLVNYLLGA